MRRQIGFENLNISYSTYNKETYHKISNLYYDIIDLYDIDIYFSSLFIYNKNYIIIYQLGFNQLTLAHKNLL